MGFFELLRIYLTPFLVHPVSNQTLVSDSTAIEISAKVLHPVEWQKEEKGSLLIFLVIRS